MLNRLLSNASLPDLPSSKLISKNVSRQAQCSTLPPASSAKGVLHLPPRKKVQLPPDHGHLNWLQLSQTKAMKLKIALMKVITILVSVYTDDVSRKEFIQKNSLLLSLHVDLLTYLSEEVISPQELVTVIKEIESKKISIFEQKKDDKLFNSVFAKIMAKVDMKTILELFTGSGTADLIISKEAVLRNYEMKNINMYWIVLNSKIYYITPYLMYHPGGEEIIMKLLKSSRNTVERLDKYKEYQRYHRWINETDLLAQYVIGTI
ncbi:hypothetical protein QEN19_004187 [Hanseniaspora menglaensis]